MRPRGLPPGHRAPNSNSTNPARPQLASKRLGATIPPRQVSTRTCKIWQQPYRRRTSGRPLLQRAATFLRSVARTAHRFRIQPSPCPTPVVRARHQQRRCCMLRPCPILARLARSGLAGSISPRNPRVALPCLLPPGNSPIRSTSANAPSLRPEQGLAARDFLPNPWVVGGLLPRSARITTVQTSSGIDLRAVAFFQSNSALF